MKAFATSSWVQNLVHARVTHGVFLALISSLVLGGVVLRKVLVG